MNKKNDSYEEKRKEEIDGLVKKLEEGIKNVFSSSDYKDLLKFISKMPRYSANNSLLIHLQTGGQATYVCGYMTWKNQFGRQVKKGEKAIRIMAPAPYKRKIRNIMLDPGTGKAVLDEKGNAVMEEKEITIQAFKPASVFDVSQTTGPPLPSIVKDISGDVERFDVFMEAMRVVSPVPIFFESMYGKDGYFSLVTKDIHLRDDMSQVQTIAAVIHEISHAKLHDLDMDHLEESLKARNKDNRTMEVEAESIAYVVSQHYGIDTEDNSFGYLASWSKNKELPELQASLETIQKTACEMIEAIDAFLLERVPEKVQEQDMEMTTEKVR